MGDAYKNIDEYNIDKIRKILIVFDYMTADMIKNKDLSSLVTELFIRGRKLNISLVFITKSYFKVPKDVRLNTTHFFISKIPNKRELQQTALNNSSDIKTKDFINIHKKYTTEPHYFLGNDTTLASYNSLKTLVKHIIKSCQLMIRLEMKNYNTILIEKQPKKSALSSGKIHKYEYLTGEDILPSNQPQIIEQAKFTYSTLGKAFEKQIKTIEDQGEKK